MSKYFIPFLFFFFSAYGIAQQSYVLNEEKRQDTDMSDIRILNLYNLYYSKIGIVDKLINGKEYIPYYFRSKLKPLFFYGKKRTSSLKLGGRTYNQIPLQYDTYLDELIYTDTSRIYNNVVYQIALNKDPVDGFSMVFGSDSLFFRNMRNTLTSYFNLKEGFYEVVYDGRSKYIIRHQSVAIEKDAIEEYFYRKAGYVKIGDKYTKLTSARKLIKLFGDRSEEVKKYIRSSAIKLRDADKMQIAGILNYYDNLIVSE